MRRPKPNDPIKVVFGVSPLGGNSVEGTREGMAPVRETEVQGVRLFWDERLQAHISEQAKEELDDRDISLAAQQEYEREDEFRRNIGIERV